MPSTPTYHLHDSLGYQLSLTARLQERRLEDGLRELGLTRAQWCVLLAVGNEKLSYPSEISTFVGIDRTATSRALRQMEDAGLIRRSNGQEDRRTTSVTLTETGTSLLVKGTPLAENNNATMKSRLTPAEVTVLHRLLEKVRQGETASLPRF